MMRLLLNRAISGTLLRVLRAGAGHFARFRVRLSRCWQSKSRRIAPKRLTRDSFAGFAGRRGTIYVILHVIVPRHYSKAIGTGQSMLIFAKMSRESQETAKTVPRVMWV